VSLQSTSRLGNIYANQRTPQKKVGDETILSQAIDDCNVTSGTEQINIKVFTKGATPGFELLIALGAIGVTIVLWRKTQSV